MYRSLLVMMLTISLALADDCHCSVVGVSQCCALVATPDNATVAAGLTAAGIVIQGVAVPVGVNCTDIPDDSDDSSCSGEAVWCANNDYENGVVSIGCTPLSE
ncbi:hypothetical protein ASPZODRAFT_19341 [Penicilliopsis zonata CBS 506.65]|uniref:Hydrophobin n=1 Tax=Penicilliopsis zonata CBS 506.65 TaxID=1073090 RepID=A0A1L9S8Y1_9EURO|nr:hypothetical protein ASPZODRAFT_19341 [Penicilliopsis zonata CBS 506.65]OJJ43621.1 hypothetical protein ASPZODRAFT_19341 [Penicilliopsis zonata CBS 506.65]